MTPLRETLIERWATHYDRSMAEYEADGLLKFLAAAGYAIVPVEKVRGPFLTLFLDGRNEYGSHVLDGGANTLGALYDDVMKDLERQADGFPERIISEAEAKGYEVSQCVVTRWTVHGGYEHGPYAEYLDVDDDLTALFCGTADEQRAMIAAALEAGE